MSPILHPLGPILFLNDNPFGSSAATADAVSAAANELISSVLTANPAPSSKKQATSAPAATDDIGYAETQVMHAYPQVAVGCNSLQPSASLATIPDLDVQTQDSGLFEEDAVRPDSSLPEDKPTVCDSEAEVDSVEQEHLPEPPASPTYNTLLSTSSGSTHGGEPSSQNITMSSPPSPIKVDGRAAKTPSTNCLSISYAAGSRRLVIDAGVVEKLRVFRSEGRIEATVNIEKDGENGLIGILVRPTPVSLLEFNLCFDFDPL